MKSRYLVRQVDVAPYSPANHAGMAVAVLSERFGRYVTGAEIVVDGGLALYNWIDARAGAQ